MYAQYSWKVPYPKRRVLFFSFRLTGLLDQSSLSLSLEADGVSQERTWHREFRCRLLCRKRERERETSPNAILILGFSLSIPITHSNCSLSASVFLARTDFIYVRRSINLWLVTHYSAERPELISNAELSRDAGRRPGRGDPVQLPSVHPNRRDLPLIIYETTELPVIGLAVQLKGQPEWRSLTTYWQSWQKEEGSYWNIWDVQGAKFFSPIHGIYVTVTAAKIPLFFSPFVRDALPPCRLPPIRNQETRGVTWVPYRLRAADFVTYPRPFILPFFSPTVHSYFLSFQLYSDFFQLFVEETTGTGNSSSAPLPKRERERETLGWMTVYTSVRCYWSTAFSRADKQSRSYGVRLTFAQENSPANPRVSFEMARLFIKRTTAVCLFAQHFINCWSFTFHSFFLPHFFLLAL